MSTIRTTFIQHPDAESPAIELNVDGTVALPLADSDNVNEGTTNLYFTDARADGRIAAADLGDLSNVDTTGAGAGDVLAFDGSKWVPEGGRYQGVLLREVDTTGVASVSIDNVFTTDYEFYWVVLFVKASNNSNLFAMPRTSVPADREVLGWFDTIRDRQNVVQENRSGAISALLVDLNVSRRNVNQGGLFVAKVAPESVGALPRNVCWETQGGAFAPFVAKGAFNSAGADIAGLRFFVTGAGITFDSFKCSIYGVNLGG